MGYIINHMCSQQKTVASQIVPVPDGSLMQPKLDTRNCTTVLIGAAVHVASRPRGTHGISSRYTSPLGWQVEWVKI